MVNANNVTVESVKERLQELEVGEERYVCSSLTKRVSEDVFHCMYQERDIDNAAATLAEFFNL